MLRREPTETDIAAFCAENPETIDVLTITEDGWTHQRLSELSELLQLCYVHYFVSRRVFPERVARGASA